MIKDEGSILIEKNIKNWYRTLLFLQIIIIIIINISLPSLWISLLFLLNQLVWVHLRALQYPATNWWIPLYLLRLPASSLHLMFNFKADCTCDHVELNEHWMSMSRCAIRDYQTLKTLSTIGIASLFQSVVMMIDIMLKNLSTVAFDSDRLMIA